MIKLSDNIKYFDLIKQFDLIPFNQSKSWYDYLKSKNEEVILMVDSDKNPQIAFLGREKTIPIIRKRILLIDTPLIKSELSDKSITKKFLELTKHNYSGIELDLIMKYDIRIEIGVRRAGFVRPLGFTRCPLTLYLDFEKQFNFDKSWRNSIDKATKLGVTAIEILNPTFSHAETFCNLFQETRKKKGLRYEFLPKNILNLLHDREFRMFFALHNDKIVSAHIVYVNNKVCYSVFRGNSMASRGIGASHYLYNFVLNTLKSEGNSYYDFGRIPPSRHNTDSVYTFKIGSRGEKIQYTGEWTYYKSLFTEYFIHLGKVIIGKKSRY